MRLLDRLNRITHAMQFKQVGFSYSRDGCPRQDDEVVADSHAAFHEKSGFDLGNHFIRAVRGIYEPGLSSPAETELSPDGLMRCESHNRSGRATL